MPHHNVTQDTRPKRGLWSPGEYFGKCDNCQQEYIGDKRSRWCADCAYCDHGNLNLVNGVWLCQKCRMPVIDYEPDDEPESLPCYTSCPKCGYSEVKLKHLHEGIGLAGHGRRVELSAQAQRFGMYIQSDAPDYVVVKEHLQCNCELCGYEWRIDTL